MMFLKEVAAELTGMFFGDARMTAAILLLIAVSAVLMNLASLDPLIGGTLLALGCPGLLIANLHREKVLLRR
jgi:hypothetical protein